jgi:hypothetical protein
VPGLAIINRILIHIPLPSYFSGSHNSLGLTSSLSFFFPSISSSFCNFQFVTFPNAGDNLAAYYKYRENLNDFWAAKTEVNMGKLN